MQQNFDACVIWVSLGDNDTKNGGDHFYPQSAAELSQEIFLNNQVKRGRTALLLPHLCLYADWIRRVQ